MVRRHVLLCAFLSTLLVLAAGGRALADPGDGNFEHGPMSKVGSDLAVPFNQHQVYLTRGYGEAFVTNNSLLPLSDDLVLIDAVAAWNADQLLSDLEALGLRDAAVYGAYVSGRLPIQAIDDMAALSLVTNLESTSASTILSAAASIAVWSPTVRTPVFMTSLTNVARIPDAIAQWIT